MTTLILTIDRDTLEIGYTSPSELMADACLRALFDGGLVSDCRAMRGDVTVFRLPIMSWARLCEAVVSNSATLLRT